MPAAVAIPLITGAIAGGAKIASGAMQASANKNSAKLQAQTAANAENVLQSNHQQALDAYNKWLSGTAPPSSLAALMGGQPAAPPQYAPTSGPTLGGMMGAGPAGGSSYSQAGPTGPAMAMPNAITLRAPTGQTKQFQANDPAIQQYLQRGATRVN